MYKLIFLKFLINLVGYSLSQQCNPKVVEWFPHQNSCQNFVLCYHGNPIERPCAPGLHFSPTELKCMFPVDARCDENYSCPKIDDVDNPVFLPDRIDCQRYFVCFNGSPIGRGCANGLWWDIVNDWCTVGDKVTCDSRTPNNPRNPTTTEPTSTEVTTVVTESPISSVCAHINHLFNDQTGLYMKSSCILRNGANYEQSEEFCKSHNMNLFVIDNSFVQSAFFTTTTNSLSDFDVGFVWINGRRETTGDWYSFTPSPRPLYNGINWVETPIDGRSSGDCLRYSTEHGGKYLAMGELCSSGSYFICEFFSKPLLNTDDCWNESALFSDDGNYLKTSCIIDTGVDGNGDTYDEAERRCIDNGMTLFVINNSTVQSSLFEATTQALINQPYGFLWINGRRDSQSQSWFVNAPRRELLYNGVDWVQTESIDGRTTGDCLRYSQQHGPYRAIGHDCQARSWIICEY